MKKPDEWVTGNVTLNVGGTPLKMEMTVPAKPIKPQRMLPVFQQMAGSFVQMGIDHAASQGETVSCAAGCGACCRQMVPLAEIEARYISDVVEAMEPERRDEVRARFKAAVERVADAGIFERLNRLLELEPSERERLIVDYFRLGVACPFLENEACSIHPDRPVACREYLVSSPPANCADPRIGNLKPIEAPIKVSKPLRRVGQSRPIAGVDFIPLVLALEWSERNPDRFPEKTGEQWMAEFFSALTGGVLPSA